MTATARGVFELLDKASEPMKAMRKQAELTQAAFKSTGDELDRLNNTTAIRSVQGQFKELGNTSQSQRRVIGDNMRGISNEINRMSNRAKRDIGEVIGVIRVLAAQRATVKIDVDTGAAMADIAALDAEMKALSKNGGSVDMLARKTRTLTSALGGGGGGGGGSPGGVAAGGGGLAGGLASAASGVPLMAVAMVAAAPAVVALTGAVSALIGSLGMAVGGAGALGIGVMGQMVVGVGALVAVIKPALSGIKEAKKAQDTYNQTVKQYGVASAQAVTAKKVMDQAFKKAAPGSKELLDNITTLGRRWRELSKPGQRDFVGLLNDALKDAHKLLPTFADVANKAMKSARGAAKSFLDALTTPEWKTIITTLGDGFSRGIGLAGKALQNLALFFGRIAEAATPMVIDMLKSIDRWTSGLAKSASSQSAVQRVISKMVDQLKSWVKFFGAAIKLAAAFFGAGAKKGQTMLEGITNQLNKWTDWIHKHPAEMQAFFDRTIDSAGKLVDALGQIGKSLGNIADALLPILNGFSQLVGLLGSTGALTPLLALGGAKYGAGMIGKLRGGGSAAAAATGTVARSAATGAGAIGGARALAYTQRFPATTGTLESGLQSVTPPTTGGGIAGGARLGAPVSQMGSKAYGLRRLAGPLAAAGSSVAGFLAPVAALSALYGAATTQGGFGNRVMGAASGATFGLLPAPYQPASGEIGESAYNAVLKSAASGHAAHFRREGYGGESINVRAPFIGVGIRNPTAGRGALPGVNQFSGQFTGKGVSRGQARTLATGLGTQARVLESSIRGASGKEREALMGELQAVRVLQQNYRNLAKAKQAAYDEKMSARANRMGGELGSVFDVYNKKLGDTHKATQRTVDDLLKEFHHLHGDSRRELGQQSLDWIKTQQKTGDITKSEAKSMRQDVLKEMRTMGRGVQVVNGTIYTGTQAEWKQIAQALQDPVEKAREKVTAGFTQIQQAALGNLQAMGYTPARAKALIQGLEAGKSQSQANNDASAPARRLAGGGRIPGMGLQDTVSIAPGAIAAPGELVVNRHTERRIAQQYGVNLGAEVARETRKHSQAFATGGRYGGVTGPMAKLIARLDGMGFHHGSTTSGTHAANSYHYRGMAADFGDASNNMRRLWATVYPMRRQFAELFGPSYLTPKPTLMHNGVGFSDPGLQTQHNNHIHIALAGGNVGNLHGSNGGLMGNVAAAVQRIHLKSPHTGVPGVAGVLGDLALNATAKGLQRKINQKLGADGGGGGAMGTGAYAGGGALNGWLAKALRLTHHYSSANLSGLRAMALGESGGDPNARQQIHDINSTNGSGGAMGLLQTIPSTFNAYKMAGHNNIFNPVDNAIASIRYQFAKYGHIVGHAGYEMGGRIPEWGGWHGRGGQFRARKPTLIGVGERENETVTITRDNVGKPGGNSGGREIHFHNHGTIVNREEGDISDIVLREMKKVAAHLDNDDDELG